MHPVKLIGMGERLFFSERQLQVDVDAETASGKVQVFIYGIKARVRNPRTITMTRTSEGGVNQVRGPSYNSSLNQLLSLPDHVKYTLNPSHGIMGILKKKPVPIPKRGLVLNRSEYLSFPFPQLI